MTWPVLPYQVQPDAGLPLPTSWKWARIENLYDQLPSGKRKESKTCGPYGSIPVLSQADTGFLGFHSEAPGVISSRANPVVTFANHTCAMRVMRQPFSVIQNVFPMVGRQGVCTTLYLYYATKGRVNISDYKGHHPQYRLGWIPLPPLETQRKIAAVLSTYDDLIENNTRRIQILEEMAQALYREWFVHFRFPGHEQSNMVESEMGLIPEGWEVASL